MYIQDRAGRWPGRAVWLDLARSKGKGVRRQGASLGRLAVARILSLFCLSLCSLFSLDRSTGARLVSAASDGALVAVQPDDAGARSVTWPRRRRWDPAAPPQMRQPQMPVAPRRLTPAPARAKTCAPQRDDASLTASAVGTQRQPQRHQRQQPPPFPPPAGDDASGSGLRAPLPPLRRRGSRTAARHGQLGGQVARGADPHRLPR